MESTLAVKSSQKYSRSHLRTLALYAQGLTPANIDGLVPDSRAIAGVAARLGCIQIDTIHKVRRSHYLTLWSRIGHYDPGDFDRLIYSNDDRRFFEYWLHAACIIPLSEYRYRLPLMQRFRENGFSGDRFWHLKAENLEMMQRVMQKIRDEGGVRTSDFDGPRPGIQGWWSWKPAKIVLEYLFWRGDLMIASREKFQRLYDLTERVLPHWVDTSHPAPGELARHQIEQAVRAFGVCQASNIKDFVYDIQQQTAKETIRELLKEGTLIEIEARLAGGKSCPLLIHRDDMLTLDQIADGTIQARRCTFLSPFDGIFWPKKRDRLLWNFEQVLEAYKPKPLRKWGYFCMPILYGERFVGRFDPRMDRKKGILHLEAIYLEEGINPDEEMIHAISNALRDFMRFHDAANLVIERSVPGDLAGKLMAERGLDRAG
jgi:uncharacterized protein